MYNFLVPVEKKWREPFLRVISLLEIIIFPILIGLERFLVKDKNLFYSNYPVRYSCRHLIFIDFLQYKLRFIFFGEKTNQMFIKDKIEEIQFRRDQSGDRNSKRNIFIRKEFDMYKSIVSSDLYENIIFNSILFDVGLIFLNKAIKNYKNIQDNKIASLIKKRTSLDLRISFPEQININRNSIIEYEFYRSIKHNEDILDFKTCTKNDVVYFLENKYTKSFKNLENDDYETIIYKLNEFGVISKNVSILNFSILCTKQAINIASFLEDEVVEIELKVKLSKLFEIKKTEFE